MLDWIGLKQGLDYQQTVFAVSPALSPTALSPKTWPFGLEWLPDSACLVGGTVRDALLGRHSEYLDLDFVLPVGAVETAQAIARHYKAGYVLLDAERQIARVVFQQGTADFAQQVGPNLEADLERRDFTVNAIAYNPHTDQLLDPLQGYADLQRHTIRMVSPENLREDPLRLLRAYRQAAQLGFVLDEATRSVIRQLAPLLRRIAAERVQSELNYLLNAPKGTAWLRAAWQDGLLQDWFPEATARSVEWVAAIDHIQAILEETMPNFATELVRRLRHSTKLFKAGAPGSDRALDRTGGQSLESSASGSTRTWLTVAKLASLLPSHPANAESQLRRLKYSRTEIQSVCTILKYLPLLMSVVEPDCSLRRSLREQFEFFQGVGVTFPAVAILALAAGVPLEAIVPFIQRFLTPDDPVAHPIPVLTGQDLMEKLNLPPGPQIGHLLAEIQRARAEGTITTPAEALALAQQLSSER